MLLQGRRVDDGGQQGRLRGQRAVGEGLRLGLPVHGGRKGGAGKSGKKTELEQRLLSAPNAPTSHQSMNP